MNIIKEELSQANTRIIVSMLMILLTLSLVYIFHNITYIDTYLAISIHTSFSIAVYFGIKKIPGEFLFRIIATICLDLFIVSWVIYSVGIDAIFVYPLYLWIIIGNGMRFGEKYFYISLAITILFFSIATSLSVHWQEYTSFAFSLNASFIILSLFYLKLLKKLNILNQKISIELERTKHISLHDHLTDLPNRAYFNEAFQKELDKSKRNNNFFLIAYMDLNDFKPVNDTYGHDYGDLLLQKVSQRLKLTLRESDFVARLGGDEFGMILTTVNDIESSYIAIQRIREIIREPYILFGTTIHIHCSIGMATYPKDGNKKEDLLKVADKNMYLNKKKNCSKAF